MHQQQEIQLDEQFTPFASLCQETEYSVEENRHTALNHTIKGLEKTAGRHPMQCFLSSGNLALCFRKKIRFPTHHLPLRKSHCPLTLCLPSIRYLGVFRFVLKNLLGVRIQLAGL